MNSTSFSAFLVILLACDVMSSLPSGSLELKGGVLATEPTAQITDAPASDISITASGNQDEVAIFQPGNIEFGTGGRVSFNNGSGAYELTPGVDGAASTTATVLSLGPGTTATVIGEAVVTAADLNDPVGAIIPGSSNPAATIID